MLDHLVETTRLLIRGLRKEDEDSIYSYRSLPEVARYQLWEPYTKQDALDYIEKNPFTGFDKVDEYVSLVVVAKESNEVVGDCCYVVKGSEAEIGFNISPKYQSQGIAKEAANSLINYLWSKNIPIVSGITDSENIGSIKVLEAVGMSRVPDFEEKFTVKGLPSIEWKYETKKI